MIPFFVVDRPISLEIIKGIKIPSGKKIGLMAHANTSPNFRAAFRAFPSRQVIKMCDSAIFDAERSNHETIFAKYEEMGADYGVMIDVLQNSAETLKNAENALKSYNRKIHSFKLVAVAQGHDEKEYLECYEQLNLMGFKYIAVGGLLRRYEKTARYVRVRDESLLEQVLTQIRAKFNPKWLFALGSFNPSRINLFKRFNVWGDYKGWIFNYKKRDEFLTENIKKLATNHLAHVPVSFTNSLLGKELVNILSKREQQIKTKKKANKNLVDTKRQLRNLITEIYSNLLEENIEQASQIAHLKNRAILDRINLSTIKNVIKDNRLSNHYFINIDELSGRVLEFQKEHIKASKKLERYNKRFLTSLQNIHSSPYANEELKEVSNKIAKTLHLSEQTHRISQVQSFIEDKILERL